MSDQGSNDEGSEDAGDANAAPSVPIVGIGASAGGLAPLQVLLGKLPPSTGMAYLVLLHQSPSPESHLQGLLQKESKLPVEVPGSGGPLEPDTVYLCPAGQALTVERGMFQVEDQVRGQERSTVIDQLFTSIADEAGDRAVGVLLSGMLSDGVQGLRAIRGQGGLALVQDPEEAEYDQMPAHAIQARAADAVLPVDGIAQRLLLAAEGWVERPDRLPGWDKSLLLKVISKVRDATGVRFEDYKRSTVERRVQRRMMATGSRDLEAYLARLESDDEEVQALFEDLLIQVTRFFREQDLFDILNEEVLPRLAARDTSEPLRVWVAGCATGEEVYSVAILLEEFFKERGRAASYQVFGSDVSPWAIQVAREAVYPTSITENVPEDLLKRYFEPVDRGYRVQQKLRARCIFAVHDLTQDPPFSKIDLILCRNVLIYLGPSLQRRVAGALHYALVRDGVLAVGRSESMSRSSDLFEEHPLDRRLLLRKDVASPVLRGDLGGSPSIRGLAELPAQHRHRRNATFDAEARARSMLAERFAPPGVVVSHPSMEVEATIGDVSPFLKLPSGQATLNLLKMADKGLAPRLKHLGSQAVASGQSEVDTFTWARTDGELEEVTLEAIPLGGPASQDRVLFIFNPGLTSQDAGSQFESAVGNLMERLATWVPERVRAHQQDAEALREELEARDAYAESIVEDYEITNEELRAAHEEALSANEELHSTNEELETAKEELQSSNEELVTLNDKLQERHEEIQSINDDLVNTLRSVDLAIVILDREMRIRRATEPARDLLNIRATDTGRPITDLSLGIEIEGLPDLMERVIEDVKTMDRDVRGPGDRWYHLRLTPYRTQDGAIGGTVLVLGDLDASSAVQAARTVAEGILRAVGDPVLLLGPEHTVRHASPSFHQVFATTPGQVEDLTLWEVAGGMLDLPELHELLERRVVEEGQMDRCRASIPLAAHERTFRITAYHLAAAGFQGPWVVLALTPVAPVPPQDERG
ncbi:MAG: CheR family methyltransferase [Candidatus Thermoplasmatota archaeon]|nr:CheR family methyltransferase [Candidatus Thermoplasmatota archaeon]